MRHKRTVTFFVLLLVALGQFAIDIYLPSFPSMVRDLNTTDRGVQLTLTFFLISFAFSQLVYGPLSDRFGRRKILLSGLVIFILSALGAACARSINFLLVMRLIQGFGIGAANVLCRAILRDLYQGKELAKKITLLAILWVSSPIIAPVIGGYIEHYLGWRMNFGFLIAFVGVILLWSFFFLPETKDFSERQSAHIKTICKNYGTLVKSRPFMGYVIADLFLYGVFSAFYVAAPFLLQNVLGFSPVAFGWAALIISCGYLLGSLANIRLVHLFDQKLVLRVGAAWVFAASVAYFFTARTGAFNIYSFMIPLLILFFGMAFVFTNCIGLSISIYPHLAGSASALWGFLNYLGGTLASLVMAHLHAKSQLPFATLIFLLCGLTFLTLIWGMIIPTKKKDSRRRVL